MVDDGTPWHNRHINGARSPRLFIPGGRGVITAVEDVISIDDVMARRYAEVSGDYNDHHFSVEGARRSGFDAPFCTDCARWPSALAR